MESQEGHGNGAAAGLVSIPRRLRCPHAMARRLSLPEAPPSAKVRCQGLKRQTRAGSLYRLLQPTWLLTLWE